MEISAVEGTMVVISTGASIVQVNISKLRRPSGTVDLEQSPDSRERTRAPVLCLLSCRGQIDVWELFVTSLILALSLIDKDSWLQTQSTLEQRKLRASHHSYCRAFWSKLKEK